MASVAPLTGQSFKFGVMADTQWSRDDGRNPGSCAADIVKAINPQFVKHGVKFVIQVGDLVDKTGSTAESVANAEDMRAVWAQELYNAGIGYFPVRGNHDGHPLAAVEFKRIYPQAINGAMNSSPVNIFSIFNPDAAVQPFPTRSGSPFVVGRNFSSPDPSTTNGMDWRGLSYAFDYENARFVLIDQFAPPNIVVDPNQKGDKQFELTIDVQEAWIEAALGGKPAGSHAFVFAHKGLISENHVDTLFGKDPSQKPAAQDAFITAMYKSGVRYYIQGHDHMHNRSLFSVTSGTPMDGASPKVQNIICASDSHKFYTPNVPANDDKYDLEAFGHRRQAQISQDLHRVGYYIYTVDGPRVTGEYYAAEVPNATPNARCKLPSPDMCEFNIPTTPPLNFVKVETFGYSLNGKEFLVCQAGQAKCNSSYTQVADSHEETAMKILSGANGSRSQDFDHRPFIKTVNTGWSESGNNLASRVLTLWGMAEPNNDRTDEFTLCLTYVPTKSGAGKGEFGLASRDDRGNWINAVDKNQGGNKKFVAGAWKPGYRLGTYGIDPKTRTAWAVVNYNGDFAVTSLAQ